MLQCRPLTDTFGAEIQGIQLTADMDDATFNEVRQSWADHELLLFRGQNLSEDDLIAFSRRFGKLEIHVRQEWLSHDHPEVLVLSNMKVDGKSIGGLANSEINWHYDQIYLPRPAVGSLLFSVAIPPEGGATYFADMCGAYDALPSHLKSKIEGRQAVQSYDNFNTGHTIKTKDAIKKKTPDVTHPIVRVHPITGRPALYVCPGMTTLIVGLDEDENRAVLDELFTFSTQPEFIYRHDWQIGDAILWDNACTMHRRDGFDDKYDRLMKRTTILPPEHLAVPV
jgi:taurine dioxygenase